MKAIYSPEASKDLQVFSREVRDAVRKKVDELKESPTGHEDSKLIKVGSRQVYRLEVKEERGGEIDHRVIYDVEDGRLRIYSVFDRDQGYDEDEIGERL